MKWEEADISDFPRIVDFLSPYEHTCVSLTSRLQHDGRPSWPVDKPSIFLLRNRTAGSSEMEGVFYISPRGLALPVLSDTGLAHPDTWNFPLPLNKRIKKIHTCIGTRDTVEKLEARRKTPKFRVDYYLYIYLQNSTHGKEKPYSRSRRMDIHRAGPEDVDFLFSLYEGYEKEEVLLEPDIFNKNMHRLLFLKSLEEQIIFYGARQGVPIAKAGTNARGWKWYQLGGVYTLPKYRNQGLASALVSRTCREMHELGKNICLFAKINNPRALKLYEHLGFVRDCGYKISYFS